VANPIQLELDGRFNSCGVSYYFYRGVSAHAYTVLKPPEDSCAEAIIVHKQNIDESFFDLRSGLAGEMLQKVVNYRLQLAIIGDFSIYESKSLKAFMAESNRSNTIVFVSSIEEALKRFK
jgi:hypothetical protein